MHNFPSTYLTISGPSVNSRKVGEYGGNTLGYGSRSVLGGGWPGDVMKVDGDTLTATFEMRSGREHNTPDRALWGFRLSVRAEEAEAPSCIQPATSDIALTLAEVISYSLEVTTIYLFKILNINHYKLKSLIVQT